MNSPLSFFSQLAPIPRPSKHESAVADFLASWFASRGATVSRDSANNLRADLVPPGADPASPPVILQAHLDMVCATAPGSTADPATQGVVPYEENGLLRARGTSLGADDGIGIALAMTLFADPPPGCPPLRAIFTSDEESGMSGASALSPSWLSDARALLNLDWEEACQFCTASAASQTFTISAAYPPGPPPDEPLDWFSLRLSGPRYPGGHSGSDIHLDIPHPGIDLLDFLGIPDSMAILAEFHCGHAPNAIPTSATALVGIPRDDVPDFLNAALPGLEIAPADAPSLVAAEKRAVTFNFLLAHLLQGVIKPGATPAVPDSSANIGIIDFTPSAYRIVTHARDIDPRGLVFLRDLYARFAKTSDAAFHASPVFPGWTLSPSSPLLSRALEIAQASTGRPWTAAPTHAGLECGIFAQKAPTLPILSLGPTVTHPHTPDESLDLSTLPPTLAFLRSFLPALASSPIP